jgi:hypothetical protein
MFKVRLKQKACIAMLMMVGSASTLATEGATLEPTNAIWKLQRVEFNFRSMSTYYSCDGLRQKITNIMMAIGARDGVRVDMRCNGGLTNDAFTLITLKTPVEATAENIVAETTYSPELQLAARLNKVRLPSANDIEQFAAEWRSVELNRQRRLNLAAGDCELLRGLVTQVIPHLSVRVEKQRLNCAQGSTRAKPVLHVTALMPAPVVPLAYAPIGDRAGTASGPAIRAQP